MKHLFYVRHGQTHMNVAGKLSGQIETPLTDEGRKEALVTGQKLKAIRSVDYIVCSPYARAYETAKIIAAEINFPIDKIETNPLFVERNFGVLEGTIGTNFLDVHEYKDFDTVDGVETIEQLQKRAVEALQYIRTLSADNVLVVGHGAFGRAFRRAVMNLPYTDEYLAEFKIGNAQILELM